MTQATGLHLASASRITWNARLSGTHAGLESRVPHHFKMGTVAEDRAHVLQNAISFEDALRVFRDWHSGLIPVQASFLGKAGVSGTVRA